MCIFQTVVYCQYLLPVNHTLIKLFTAPGNLCKFVACVQIGTSQFIAPEGTPIAIKRLHVVASIKVHHFHKCCSCNCIISGVECLPGPAVMLLENSYVIPHIAPIERSQVEGIGPSL